MNDLTEIFVSTISGKPSSIFEDIRVANEAGVGGLHFDVMDGIFVPRLGLYPELLAEIRQCTDMFIEVHCMLTSPQKFLGNFISAGANRLVFHIETEVELNSLIFETKAQGLEVGIAVNPKSPVGSLAPYVSQVDSIMLMGIEPGIPRHPFIESTIDKLAETQQLLKSEQVEGIEICIDGGVTFDNLGLLSEKGADTFVCGSATVYDPARSFADNLKLIKSKFNHT